MTEEKRGRGRPKGYRKYPDETPEEKKARIRAINRESQRRFYYRQKAKRDKANLELAFQKYENEILGGQE